MANIALLGTGLMGIPFAERLLAAGHRVAVYNRTVEKTAYLRTQGARVAESPSEALENAEFVMLALADAAAIREVLLQSRVRGALSGKTLIQMGTIKPSESRELLEAFSAADAAYMEAPVLGSIPEARAGTLIVMVGATDDQYRHSLELLRCFGPNPMHIGSVGQAAGLKLAFNQLIAALTTGFALSLGFVQRQGIEVERFMALLRTSALYAPTFDKKLQRMQEREFGNPNFPIKHLAKDVTLFLREAQTLGLNTAALQGIRDILDKALGANLADADYAALYNVVVPVPH